MEPKQLGNPIAVLEIGRDARPQNDRELLDERGEGFGLLFVSTRFNFGTSLWSCKVSRETFRGRSAESTTPYRNRR